MGHTIVSGGSRATKPIVGTPISDLSVGSIVKMKVNGTVTDFLIVNQGIPQNSSLYDASCDGTWLLMKDCYESRQWHSSNVADYANSSINAWLNGEFYNSIGTIEKAAIKQVKIPYRAGSGYDTTVTSGSNGLGAKIFLLSGAEVNWSSSTSSYIPNDGACLSYFSGCATKDSKRIGYLNGSATFWWLRSPYCNRYGTGAALFVLTNGNWSNSDCSYSYGIRPALVLPSQTKIDKNGMVVG